MCLGIFPPPEEKCRPLILVHNPPHTHTQTQSLVSSSSTTKHHRKGYNTPPGGYTLDTATLTEVSPRATVAAVLPGWL